jgi:DNA mismatch repair protein MSH4
MEVNYLQCHPIQMVYYVAQRLISLKYSNQDEDSIRQALRDLKEQYIDGRL